ncbi:hypothetical protein TBK1r_38280 [Stieleria magnilauensis]|uniref:Uncharacterized protein n=1 Tax=Stieleria magnilauensis TaxID=2527963 RepID=A0ABX5XUC5_9BACT|nr:hypothetical protein TBK1r_38280 [Planctomycetes bacterium TBK1r]
MGPSALTVSSTMGPGSALCGLASLRETCSFPVLSVHAKPQSRQEEDEAIGPEGVGPSALAVSSTIGARFCPLRLGVFA